MREKEVPMAVAVIMPRQGNTVESCTITKWNKRKGDKVEVGDVLFSYETDKAAFDEDAKVAGTLIDVFFQVNDDVPCLMNVCVIGAPGEATDQFRPVGAVPASAPAAAEKAEAPVVTATPEVSELAEPAVISGDLKISPRAKALAEARGADLSFVVPTGPDGRVIARDVQALIDAGRLVSKAAAAAYAGGAQGTGLGGRVTLSDLVKKPEAVAAAVPAAPAAEVGKPVDDGTTEPLSNMRKVIAKAMMGSLSSMAQLTHNLSFDATEIQNLRKTFKEKGEALGMSKITLNDIIMFAVVRTLKMPAHRALNANLIDDGKTMKYFAGVHLGFACDTDRGLMVPTIFSADKMSLKELSDATKQLAKDAKDGKISPDYLRGASFTVSNLGSLGIESFTPVINPPQTGILGVCAITTRVKEVGGQLVAYPAMTLSLTYDHRAMDGTPASMFLADLKVNLENFTLLLAKG
jgi:pyruvate dehydrogenase E2 component (dihydrolipoamide acetyltransferase)